MKFDAWKVKGIWKPDYKSLRRSFGLQKFNFKLKNEPNFVKNNLIIGHEHFEKWLHASSKGKAAVVSGFMPSGIPHLGTLTIFKQMAYYQKEYNAKLYIPIADLEAIYVRHLSMKEVKRNTITVLAHLAAAGVDIKNSVVYFQSQNFDTLRETFYLIGLVSRGELDKIYWKNVDIPFSISGLLMVSDILYPLAHKYNSVLVMIGIDEISHIKLVSKLAERLGVKDFISVTYSDLIPGLKTSKMSKSMPENSILLSDSVPSAMRKVEKAIKAKNINLYISLVKWFSDTMELETSLDKQIKHAKEIIKKEMTNHRKNYIANLPNATKIANSLFLEYKKPFFDSLSIF
jgi:tryptophanyl-tRNA synthetase